ncbi:hypothetical protein ACLOJK_040776 [Asimina triloba]
MAAVDDPLPVTFDRTLFHFSQSTISDGSSKIWRPTSIVFPICTCRKSISSSSVEVVYQSNGTPASCEGGSSSVMGFEKVVIF